jgi:hypothetical protein
LRGDGGGFSILITLCTITMRVVALLFVLVAPSFAADAPSFIPIRAARLRPAGEAVTVMGLVTVPSAAFRSSSDDNGFAIQDQTAGIWVSTKDDLRLKMGQRVLVKGKRGERAKKLQIVTDAAGVTRLPGQELRVATGSVGPATLGDRITIEGTIREITDDRPYGRKVSVDDGSGAAQVFLNMSAGITAKLQVGQTIRVTGFGSQYEAAYEVEPRSDADIQVRSTG